MKKLITEDTVILYIICSITYGLGYVIPDSLGCPVIVSLIICIAVGNISWQLTQKILFSRSVQENRYLKTIILVIVVVVFLLAAFISKKLFGYDLIQELGNEILYMLIFAVLGVILTIAGQHLAKWKIRKKYGKTPDSFIFSREEIEHLNSLRGENREIKGTYEKDDSVTTGYGTFVGKEHKKILVFSGIPYAKPPVEDLRWKAPQKPERSEKVYEAMGHSASPIQHSSKGNLLASSKQSEDCLYLNVSVTRSKVKRKPVIVVFPSMDFAKGGSEDPLTFGLNFLKKNPDHVYVSFDHRLGLLGFIDFSDVPGGDNYPDAENLGILDQIAALEWVKENIAAFDGDPENVTVMGGGSGAISISILAACERAKGLFAKAVILGGSPAMIEKNAENKKFLTKRLMQNTGAENMNDLLSLTEEELIRQTDILQNYLCGVSAQKGLVPEDLFTDYKSGKACGIRYIYGTSVDELSYYLALEGRKDLTGAEKEYIEDLKKKLDPLTIREYCAALSDAGSEVNMLHWEIKNEIEKFGSGATMIMAAFLGNLEAAVSVGCVIPADVAEVLQSLLVKFIKGSATELYENEIEGIHAIQWTPYPNELYVTKKEIICEKYHT